MSHSLPWPQDEKRKSELTNLLLDIQNTGQTMWLFLWIDCIFSFLKMDLPLTKWPKGRALAVFFEHLFFHWETADEFTFREAHTPLIQPQIRFLTQNQMEKSFPAPRPPPTSSFGTMHVSATLHAPPRPIHGHGALAFSSWLLPVLVHSILLYLLKCWKVTVKMWNCNF